MKFLILSVFLVLTSAFAQNEEANKVYVQTIDVDADTSSLTDPRYSVKKGVENEPNFLNELPSPEKVKELIHKAGLEKEVGSLDQLDLDLFCMNLKKKPLDVVARKYPDIDPKKLGQLKALLEGVK